MRRHHLLIEPFVAVGLRVDREPLGAEPGRPAEYTALGGVVDQLLQDASKLFGPVGVHEPRHAVPVLTQAGNLSENKGALRQRRFEDRQAKRFISCGEGIDGRTPHCFCDISHW